MSFVERSNIQCPFLGESFIRGYTVLVVKCLPLCLKMLHLNPFDNTTGSGSEMEEVNAANSTVLPTTIIIGLALGIFAGLLLVFTFFIILLVISLVWFVKKVNKKKDKQAYKTQQPRKGDTPGTADRPALQRHANGDTNTAVVMKTNAAYASSRCQISTKDYNMPSMHIIDQSARPSNDYDNDPKDHYDYVIVI